MFKVIVTIVIGGFFLWGWLEAAGRAGQASDDIERAFERARRGSRR